MIGGELFGKFIILSFRDDEEALYNKVISAIYAISNFPIISASADAPLRFGSLQIDPQCRLVWQSGQTVDLTPMEFDILLLLARRPGQVFSAHQIYAAVATDSFDAGWTGISSMVYKLRRKLGADIIETVRGHGYNSRRLSGNPVQNRTSAENPALQAAGGRLDLSQNGSASLGLSRRLHSRFAANRCPKNPFLPPISREWTRMGNR